FDADWKEGGAPTARVSYASTLQPAELELVVADGTDRAPLRVDTAFTVVQSDSTSTVAVYTEDNAQAPAPVYMWWRDVKVAEAYWQPHKPIGVLLGSLALDGKI